MDYVRFGSTGLTVSRLCLGCMTYGDPGWRERLETGRQGVSSSTQAPPWSP